MANEQKYQDDTKNITDSREFCYTYTTCRNIASGQVYPLNRVEIDTGKNFDVKSHRYVINEDGIYLFQWGGFIGKPKNKRCA